MLEGALDDRTNSQRFLNIIKANIDRIISLVNDLMSLATIESNEGIISLHSVDWKTVIQEVYSRQEINCQKKNIEFSCEIPDSTLAAKGSRKAMTHILDNLVQNAINYTAPGGKIDVNVTHNDDQVILSPR